MGFLGKLGDALHTIEYHVSDAPEIKGKRFEDHVESLFNPKYFSIVEKTHSHKTNEQRYVESSLNPDFIFRYEPTKEKFAVECKYRTSLNNKDMLEWSYPAQLQRYREFAYKSRIPVFVVIGLCVEVKEHKHDDWHEENFMFNIPLEEAKFPALYSSVFEKYERDYDKPFFWKNGMLF